MIINGLGLYKAGPIKNMLKTKEKAFGLSYGLSEVGYDIRLKQDVVFTPPNPVEYAALVQNGPGNLTDDYYHHLLQESFLGRTKVGKKVSLGRTALASSVEEFEVPANLWGELRNKSSNARQFFDATIGTDVEPGWQGFLTIEIIFHGLEPVTLPAGMPIAKAVFHEISERANYNGKYQNQEDEPVKARFEQEIV